MKTVAALREEKFAVQKTLPYIFWCCIGTAKKNHCVFRISRFYLGNIENGK